MRTKLQAVQEVSRRLGKAVPTALDTDGTSTYSYIEKVLDEASNTVQGEGWHWNTKYDVTVQALELPQGHVGIRVDTLELLDDGVTYATIYHVDTEPSEGMNVTRRNTRLYDLKNNTYTITSDKKLRYSYELDFGNIPDSFQSWIIALAAFNFNRFYANNKEAEGALGLELENSRRQATREEIRAADTNVLGTWEMQQIRGRPRMKDRSIY
jgi:hypothetical protein